RRAGADQRRRPRRPARRAARPAHRRARGRVARPREWRAPPDPRPEGRGRYRPSRGRVPRMILAFLNLQPLTWPTFATALALGGVSALMAVGIGLVFGVLRLVNFAYGQLIMAGGYALAFGSLWNFATWESILLCFGVVLVLSVLMDRLVFRPLRTSSPT